MVRPMVTIEITEEVPRRGSPTDTGTALWAFTAATGPEVPVQVRSAAEAAAAFPAASPSLAQWVGDALATGAPLVVLVRATTETTETTEAEWTKALDKLGEDYGPGQVAIPGVATAAAAAALGHHASTHLYRTALVDGDKTPTVEELTAAAASLADEDGAPRITVVAPWVKVSAPAGSSRDVPASVLVCGLVARSDAAVGHANNSPAVTQRRDAGVIRQGLGVLATFTDAERDTLNAAGVSVIRLRQGVPTLYGWRSVSTTPLFSQLGAGRMTMQLQAGMNAQMEQFLETQVDGVGALYDEVDTVLRAYFTELWNLKALYGRTADQAFALAVAEVNTDQDAAAGRVRAIVRVKLTRSAELIALGVSVTTAEGSIAA